MTKKQLRAAAFAEGQAFARQVGSQDLEEALRKHFKQPLPPNPQKNLVARTRKQLPKSRESRRGA